MIRWSTRTKKKDSLQWTANRTFSFFCVEKINLKKKIERKIVFSEFIVILIRSGSQIWWTLKFRPGFYFWLFRRFSASERRNRPGSSLGRLFWITLSVMADNTLTVVFSVLIRSVGVSSDWAQNIFQRSFCQKPLRSRVSFASTLWRLAIYDIFNEIFFILRDGFETNRVEQKSPRSWKQRI